MKIEKINWVFPIVMVQRKSDEGRSTGLERHEDERERRGEKSFGIVRKTSEERRRNVRESRSL